VTPRPATCPTCGAPTRPDSDFCLNCGTYLAWDDEPARPAQEAPSPAAASGAVTEVLPSAAVAEARPPRAAARLLVSVAGADADDAGALDTLRVAPGSKLALTATVRNQSAIVDRFVVTVDGLPETWVEVRPATSYLLPVGSHGDFERDVAITIHPPRSSEATAGPWPFTVTARSFTPATQDARVPGVLTVEPFTALQVDARPQVATGRRWADFACDIHNVGNTDANVDVLAHDAEQACWFDLPSELQLKPGHAAPASVRVHPVKTLWVGRALDHRVAIEARSAQLATPAKASPLVYRQQPWVPWWVPPFLVLLAGAALALYLALPRKVTMPAVIGVGNAFAAQQELARAGLRTHPQIKLKVLPRVAGGTIVGQVPRAGSRVPPSTPVTLQVAVAPATTIVPDLTGLKPAAAETALTRVRLKLGAVLPALDPKAKIKSQLPPAGTLRKQGALVDVVLAPRTAKVPDLRGRTPPAAEKLLDRLGLALGSVQPKLRTHAKIASQVPAPGVQRVRGTRIDVVVARRVIVPPLADMTVQQADKALATCMLKLGPLPPNVTPSQTVHAQVPEAGTHRPPGTLITLILGPKPANPKPHFPNAKVCRAG
jgi:beta-lactam-binding protein with PASTA domain